METKRGISLLYPSENMDCFKTLPEVAVHDLGIDTICEKITSKEMEQSMLKGVLSKMTDDPAVAKYRGDIFDDIYKNPQMCEKLLKVLDKINFLKDFGSFKKKHEETAGIWDLMHRLEEISDYIGYVEAIYECLTDAELSSEGLLGLKNYINSIYEDKGFAELKNDIAQMKASTADLRSLTVGINLNERFEAESIGLISVNSKQFSKSNLLSGFYDKISSKDRIKEDTEWKEDYKYQPITADKDTNNPFANNGSAGNLVLKGSVRSLAFVPDGDSAADVTRYMDKIANSMLSLTVKKLRELLSQYVTITITDITNLIPELLYYTRFAEYIKSLEKDGLQFCKASIVEGNSSQRIMRAQGVYNLKLASVVQEEHEQIVTNDLDFDKEHTVYILTGANRGGKTTITQAIGILFVLAQGGIPVPGEKFEFQPVDCIYTHFPADEDKTMDLGRLGEECKRFKEIYFEGTATSLFLLNETFSTTSFEEGYYIAKDSVKAILKKGIRTIYNTHMHKLAADVDEMNVGMEDAKACSLIMKSDNGERSYKVEIAPPEGMSYARDIAVKYGVTYDLLIK